jgi:tetratricopeptide (TPR) repeat protein
VAVVFVARLPSLRAAACTLGLGVSVAIAACASVAPPNTQQRALLLVSKQRPAEAIVVLRQHLAQQPDARTERRLLIRVLGVVGDLAAAEHEAELLAQRLGPGHALAWLELGHAYELAHRYDEALVFYDRASQVAPSDPAGPREAGLRAAHWGEVELAEPRLREALRRNARDARVWHALGLVRVRLRDLAGARAAYRAGLEADRTSLENHLGLATLSVLERDAAGALVHYDAIVKARPKMADAQLGRSWALIELRRYADAERALKHAAALGANEPAVRAQRALLARRRSSEESN